MSATVDTSTASSGISMKLLVFGFVAGFLAVPFGHQIMAYIYFLTMPGRAMPWNFGPATTAAYQAFGLPAVVNLSFWGGVWGILWALISPYAGKGVVKYIVAILFGGVCATAFSAYGVPTIKGNPVGAMSWIGFGLNGAWGLVTALLLDLMSRKKA